MSDQINSNLPEFLTACIEQEIIDSDTATRVDALRRSSGKGLSKALSELGLSLSDEEIEKFFSHASAPFEPLLLPVPPNPVMTFENFVHGKDNDSTFQVAQDFADKGEHSSDLLVFYGPISCGKTHLISAVANVLGQDRTLLVNMQDFKVELERAERLRSRAEFRKWLDKWDFLFCDDVQLCRNNESLEEEFLALLDRSLALGKSVILTLSNPPSSLVGVGARLVSRLEGGVLLSVQMPHKEELEKILKNLSGGDALTQEVLDYITEHIKNNIRALKAAGKQLLALTKDSNDPPSVDMARAIVPEPADLHHPPKPETSEEPKISPQNTMLEGAKAARFKKMFAEAETEQEQALALQIAVGERIRELRKHNGDQQTITILEEALSLLRQGDLRAALKVMK